jgi:hypothetical protein
MNELSRVRKIGGVLLAVNTAYTSPTAFQDPIHRKVNMRYKLILSVIKRQPHCSEMDLGVSK